MWRNSLTSDWSGRRALAGINRAAGRRLGIQLARSPIPGSLDAELRRLLTRLDVASVVDVGAHRGGFARRLRSTIGFQGRIASFEPSPRAFSDLRTAAAADQNWMVFEHALGAVDEMRDLHVFDLDEFNSLLPMASYSEVYQPGLAPSGKSSVSVRRLDSVWAGLACVADRTMLKIDTQGHDMQVVGGAGRLLDSFPCLLTEVPVQPLYVGAPKLHDVIEELDERGFELTGAFPVNRYARGLRVIEFDCTFVNRSHCT